MSGDFLRCRRCTTGSGGAPTFSAPAPKPGAKLVVVCPPWPERIASSWRVLVENCAEAGRIANPFNSPKISIEPIIRCSGVKLNAEHRRKCAAHDTPKPRYAILMGKQAVSWTLYAGKSLPGPLDQLAGNVVERSGTSYAVFLDDSFFVPAGDDVMYAEDTPWTFAEHQARKARAMAVKLRPFLRSALDG